MQERAPIVKAGGAERDPVSLMFRFAGEQPIAPLQMAMAGVFDRFPKLNIYLAESQCGWLWVLVHAAKDFSVPLMLASAGSVVAANVIYESFVGGHFNSSAAMLVVLVTFNLVFVVAGRKWIGRALAQ